MIRSMTGYGRGESLLFNRKFVVEIRSVNHRYNDISLKAPRIMSSFEEDIKKIISKRVFRGKTDVYIYFQSFSEKDININFNQNLADAFVSKAKEIDSKYDFNQKNYFDALLSFHDVLTIDNRSVDEAVLNEMWLGLEEALLIALDSFVKMRETEGTAIKKDILEKADNILGFVEKIKLRAPAVASELRGKLIVRIGELIGDINIDESRILMEVAMQADKISIDEELTRLFSHINQLRNIIEEAGVVGRKLDFLIQEVNREINTVGSKCNDLNIVQDVVEIKSEIEKIREQIQNIE